MLFFSITWQRSDFLQLPPSPTKLPNAQHSYNHIHGTITLTQQKKTTTIPVGSQTGRLLFQSQNELFYGDCPFNTDASALVLP